MSAADGEPPSHTNPDSTWQRVLHPSPAAVLPSSQSSFGVRNPSPQSTLTHTVPSCAFDLSSNPSLHVHVKLPIVFEQTACASQLFSPGSTHSSLSSQNVNPLADTSGGDF